MGVAIRDGYVQFSAFDAASHEYHTGRGSGWLRGIACLLFCRKVTILESDLVQQIGDLRDARFIKSYLNGRQIAPVGPSLCKPLRKQLFKGSCAARCLQQAAYELGINKIPNIKYPGFNGQSIGDRSAEAAIYGVACRLVNDSGELKQNLPGDLNNGGDCGPVGIKHAAGLLGLDSRFYCSSRLTEWYFAQRNPADWKEIKKYCPVHRTSPPGLCGNERLMLHVCNYSMLGFDDNALKVRRDHFIMQRPDGSCYNPDAGIDYPSVAAYFKVTGMRPSGTYTLISAKNSWKPVGLKRL